MEIEIDNYFTSAGREHIERVFAIFKHFEVSPDAQDWKWIKIDGAAFGDATSAYNFYIHRIKDGLSVQVSSKKDPQGMAYMFGMNIYLEHGVKKAFAYHHCHGPFSKLYDAEYETF